MNSKRMAGTVGAVLIALLVAVLFQGGVQVAAAADPVPVRVEPQSMPPVYNGPAYTDEVARRYQAHYTVETGTAAKVITMSEAEATARFEAIYGASAEPGRSVAEALVLQRAGERMDYGVTKPQTGDRSVGASGYAPYYHANEWNR